MLNPNKTEYQYNEALSRAYNLMQKDVIKGFDESDQLGVLSILIETYEAEHYPLNTSNSKNNWLFVPV